jgi:glutamine amidotransferase
VIAAVRSATEGTAPGVESAAPFGDGRYLFSHNGRIEAWPDQVDALVADIPASELLHLVARTDSALLWLMVQLALARGMTPDRALATVTARAQRSSAGRYNLLLHDGEQIVATAAGDTLFVLHDATGVTVASEPSDDRDAWTEVPDGSVVVATNSTIDVQPLERLVTDE